MSIFHPLSITIERLKETSIQKERLEVLQPLIEYIRAKVKQEEMVSLNFICTHNSRRSQLAQVWASTAATIYKVPANTYSGGVEETAFHSNARRALEQAGFEVNCNEAENPTCFVKFDEVSRPIVTFSKLFDHEANPASQFAAVMTCSDADENCPYISGAETRISLLYDDPKEYDGTELEVVKYKERSEQIGAEMLYVFKNIVQL